MLDGVVSAIENIIGRFPRLTNEPVNTLGHSMGRGLPLKLGLDKLLVEFTRGAPRP